MEMRSERHLPLDRDTVWSALNDPEVLQACIPGCEAMERVEQDAYQTAVTTKMGPVKARFRGEVRITESQPPESYRLGFEGKGGASFAKGQADVVLEADGEGGCYILYMARATVGGKLAQVGSRLLDSSARKLSDQFFDNFTRHLGGEGVGAADPETAGGSAQGNGADAPEAAEQGRGWRFWRREGKEH